MLTLGLDKHRFESKRVFLDEHGLSAEITWQVLERKGSAAPGQKKTPHCAVEKLMAEP